MATDNMYNKYSQDTWMNNFFNLYELKYLNMNTHRQFKFSILSFPLRGAPWMSTVDINSLHLNHFRELLAY